MPFNEGYTRISGDAVVHHEPRNNGNAYSHPLCNFPLSTKIVKFPQCDVFNYIGPVAPLRTTHKLKNELPSGYDTANNITATFIEDYIKDFPDSYTKSNVVDKNLPKWDAKSVKQYVESLLN